jgi:hypothetical protein
MTTTIKNPYQVPVTLPFPFRGILKPRGQVVVDGSPAQVTVLLGGLDQLGGLKLFDSGNQPADAYAKGNFYVKTLGMDGLSNVTQTLLAAGHPPGIYQLYCLGVRRSLGSAGTVTINHLSGFAGLGVLTQTRGSFNLFGGSTGSMGNFAAITIQSDGSADIATQLVVASGAGAIVFDITSMLVPMALF